MTARARASHRRTSSPALASWWLAAGGVPQPHGGVVAGAGELVAIGRERDPVGTIAFVVTPLRVGRSRWRPTAATRGRGASRRRASRRPRGRAVFGRHCTRPRRADENTDAIVRVVRTRRSQGGRTRRGGPCGGLLPSGWGTLAERWGSGAGASVQRTTARTSRETAAGAVVSGGPVKCSVVGRAQRKYECLPTATARGQFVRCSGPTRRPRQTRS